MAYGTVNIDKVVSSDGTTSGGLYGFKNRIINGAMLIDQRNAGALVSNPAGGAVYVPDRFYTSGGGSSVGYSCQQVTDAPTGFINSLKITVTTAATLSAAQFTFTRQIIEGYNIADLAWGTAAASPVAISFWVKSSLTGTFAVACINSAEDRSYPATFTINAANTWEYKTITVPGDTTGTWLTNNSNGIRLAFDLGAGSNFNGTANTWQAGWKQRTSGCVSFSQTLNATFQLTGVQLEKGSTATSFDYRPYGAELALCQRYYYRVSAEGINFAPFGIGYAYSATLARVNVPNPVKMRAPATTLDTSASNSLLLEVNGTSSFVSSAIAFSGNSSSTMQNLVVTSSGMPTGNQLACYANNNSSAYLGFGAEL